MKIKQADDLCAVNFINSLVIFDFKTYRSYILNDTAFLVWNFCKTPKDLDQIAQLLNNKYQVGLSKVLKDARIFVRQLEKKKLLVCQRKG